MNVIQQRKSLIMLYSFDIFIHKFLMELRANGIIDEMSFLQNGEVVRIIIIRKKKKSVGKGSTRPNVTLFLGSCLAQFLNTTSSSHLWGERRGKESGRRGWEEMKEGRDDGGEGTKLIFVISEMSSSRSLKPQQL